MVSFTDRTKIQRKLHELSRAPFWSSWRWRFSLGISIIALALLVRFVEDIGLDQTPNARFQVTKVIDGDTVELKDGERLRLLFIDTPERGERYFDSATALVEKLTLGKIASLQYGKRKRDNYGRLLATLSIGTVNINRELLRRGYANLYLFPDNIKDTSVNDLINDLLQAQNDALKNKRGLWSIERVEEERYLTTSRSLRFHRPSCRSVHNRSEAALRSFKHRNQPLSEGLSPCRTCRP